MMKRSMTSAARPEYIVRLGDSLWMIVISPGTTVQALKVINHLMSDTIYPNQKFIKIKHLMRYRLFSDVLSKLDILNRIIER